MFERRLSRTGSSLARSDSLSDIQSADHLSDGCLDSRNVRRPSERLLDKKSREPDSSVGQLYKRQSNRRSSRQLSDRQSVGQLSEQLSDTVSDEQLSERQSVGQLSEQHSDTAEQLSDSRSVTTTDQSDDWGSGGQRRD